MIDLSGFKYYPYNNWEDGNHCKDCDYYDIDHDDEWPIVNRWDETCAAEHDDCPGREVVHDD